jgi:CheY-like chemotaxis protein
MPKILVVEDEFAIAEVLEMALTDAGYEVLTAANGRQALERMAEAPRPDLIITDFMMPVLNAAGLVEALRSDPTYRDIPYIVMSSVPEATVRERINGYRAFVRKPFQLAMMVQLVAGMLSSRE